MNIAAADPLLLLALKFLALLAGLIGPGAALARALRVPASPATCFVGSALSLYAAVLALNFINVTISLVSLVSALAAISALALLVARNRNETTKIPPADWLAPFVRMGVWTPLYILICAVVIVRACREPLAGVDNQFRWAYLANELMWDGSFASYPPRLAEDFLRNFWVESIPPGVVALDAWCFAWPDAPVAGWTVPLVILQFWALQDLVWQLGDFLGGQRAARFACLAAVACPLLSWSLLLAQESGLTTLALLGVVLALLHWHRTQAARWAALAGFFAALGASAREYGLALPLAVAAGLLVLRADRRTWRVFALVAIPLSLAWPLRVALLTGNPFYSLPLGPLPINPRFVAIIERAADSFATPLHTVEGWLLIARYVLWYAPAALVGGIALTVAAARGRRRELLLLAGAALFVGLWLASVRYTAGGLFYSMRVAAPAVALAAVAAGVGLAAMPKPFPGGLVLTLLAAATLPGTLALPRNPVRTPWREWPAIAGAETRKPDPAIALIHGEKTLGVTLSDSAGFQAEFALEGGRVLPLWSPQADWLFDATLKPDDAVREWRDSKIRFVVVGNLPGNRPAFDFLRARAAWLRPPFRWRLVGETETAAVFALELAP